MITQKNIIYGTFTAITAAGQDATCWLDEDGDGFGGTVNVRIFHSTAGVPVFTTEITKAKRIYKSNGNDDVMFLEADSALDVFYAACVDVGATVILSVDAI